MDYKGLIEKKNDLITRAEGIVNDADTNKRELTEAEAAELARIKEALAIQDEIKDEKKELKEEVSDEMAEQKDLKEAACNEEEARAFGAWIRAVALNERTDYNMEKSGNGAVIPTTIAKKIIAKVYDICPILEKSSKYNVKGNLEIPAYNGATHDITVAYANEFEDLAASVGGFTKIELTGFLAGALVKISKSLINNSDFNLVDWVVERMAMEIARFIEHELLIGTTSPVAKVAGLSSLAETSVMTAAATGAITADEVIRLHDMVKDVYQQNGSCPALPGQHSAPLKQTPASIFLMTISLHLSAFQSLVSRYTFPTICRTSEQATA